MSRVISESELSDHGPQSSDPWVAINGNVYGVKAFAALHPGGDHILRSNCGKDSSALFNGSVILLLLFRFFFFLPFFIRSFQVAHSTEVLKKYHDKLVVGTLANYKRVDEVIAHADPFWVQSSSRPPWMRESHVVWQKKVRSFVTDKILTDLGSWQDSNRPPNHVLEALGEEGFLAVLCGSPFPTSFLPSHVSAKLPSDLDEFHEMIFVDEIARCGHFGAIAAITNGPAIALSAILKFGSREQKEKYVPEVILGKKMIALAISEPYAGSDVAGLTCLAHKQQDGSYKVVGNKKWITNAMYADYFVTAVRVGLERKVLLLLLFYLKWLQSWGRGPSQWSRLFGDSEGCRRILDPKDSSASSTGFRNRISLVREHTSFGLLSAWRRRPRILDGGPKLCARKTVHFHHHHSSVQDLRGRVHSFRIEKRSMCQFALFVLLRFFFLKQKSHKAFGGKLADLQGIRLLIAEMAAKVEMMQSWLESIVHQVITLGKKRADKELAATICMLKAECGSLYEFCANSTTHVFGGHALVASGPGKRIEGAVAAVKAYTIPAGASMVMRDFAGRQILKSKL
jgi:alkylation response protein AidB-like acyl-CoA dehydrogenase/predicted heme/steroid binding protein